MPVTAADGATSGNVRVTSLGGSTPRKPLVLSCRNDRTDVFHIGDNGKLYQATRKGDSMTSFSGWDNISSTTITTMAGVSWGPDRMDLFAVAAESNCLLHKYFNPGGHDFETVQPKGGTPIEILGDITAATFGADTLFVFFRCMDTSIAGIYWNQPQSCWSFLSIDQDIYFNGAPKVVAFQQDNGLYRLDFYVRDVDNFVRSKSLTFKDLYNPLGTNATWTPAGSNWTRLNCDPVIDDVTVAHVLNPAHKWRTHLFSRSLSNRIVHRWVAEEAKDWTPSVGWEVSDGSSAFPIGRLCQPVQAIKADDRITLVGVGHKNRQFSAQLDFEGKWKVTAWPPINAADVDAVNTTHAPVLHPNGGPHGWAKDGGTPLEIFLVCKNTSLRKVNVYQEDITPPSK